MGGQKTKTSQKTTNTYAHVAPPVTQEVTDLKTTAADLKGKISPIIRSSYAGARSSLNDSFQNPLGAHTTPAIRDATLRAGNADLSQQEAGALAASDHAAGEADFGRQAMIAGMTAPQLVQTGGTSQGTSQQSGGIGQAILGSVAGVGGAALGNPALM